MDWLRWVFLESLPALGAVVGTLLFVLVVYWRRTLRPMPLLIGLGLAVVLLVVHVAVETHREAAGGVLSAIEQDLRRGKDEALARSLSASFTAPAGGTQPMNREQFLRLVERWQGRVTIHWLRRTDLTVVESQSDAFTVEAAYFAELASEEFATAHRSRWQLWFVQRAGEWVIDRIEPVRVDGMSDRTFRSLGG